MKGCSSFMAFVSFIEQMLMWKINDRSFILQLAGILVRCSLRMKNSFISCLLMVCVSFSSLGVGADEVDVSTRYVRIHSASEVVPGRYLIGAFSRVSVALGLKSYLMSTASANHKRKAVAYDLKEKERLTFSDTNCMWQLERTDDGRWRILKPDTQLGLAATAESTDLELSTNCDSWAIQAVGDGLFKISDDARRYVGLNTASSGVYFGHYLPQVVDTVNLVLFQAVSQENVNYIPHNGDTVALAWLRAGSPYAYCDAGNFSEVSDFYTLNGQLAAGALCSRYQVEPCTDMSGSAFYLRTLQGQYLQLDSAGYVLREGTLPQMWGLDAESLFAFCGKDSVRLYVEADGSHPVLTPDAQGPAIGLLRCASKGGVDEFFPHCLAVSGACSLPELDSLLRNERYWTFDFTAADLPRKFSGMNSVKCGCNRVYYFDEVQLAGLPATLFNVVLRAADGQYCAAGPIVWEDGKPLAIPYAFEMGGEELSYVRQVFLDGGWETLYLPFPCSSLPTNFCFEQYQSVQDCKLSFKSVASLEPNVPYVFRYTGSPVDEGKIFVTLKADKSAVVPENVSSGQESSLMCGTYEPIQVMDNSENYYFLDGVNFIHAAAGSMLLPFRTYLRFPAGNHASYAVSLTGIRTSCEDSGDAVGDIYDISGRRLNGRPHGFYIQKGKVLYNSK